MTTPYSAAVLRYFGSPAHAGRVAAQDGRVESAYVEEGGAGTRILLTAAVENARLRAIRYRVFGCPHVVAAAELTCERLQGQPVESMTEVDPRELIETLGVPVEKTGRILLLEDAVRTLHQACTEKLEV